MSPAPWAVGAEIAGYRLLRDFDRDAWGEVFLAEDASARPVVIRLLDEQLAGDRSQLMEFYRQAKFGMSIEHPRVLKVLDVSQAGGRHFVATEFLGLPSLKYQLQQGLPGRKRFEESDAVRLVCQLAKILEDLHEHRSRPAVHRALTPAHILLEADGNPILSGWQWASPIEDPLPYPALGMTAELYQHLSPEQVAHRHRADPLSDVYSLGVLFYTLVTGRLPFCGRDAEETLRNKKRSAFQSPEFFVPQLSRGSIQVIRECLRAEPERRPPSMRRLREFLQCGQRVVAGYRLKAYLGRGNTGEVYQAVSPRGQEVAVKLVSPDISHDEKRRQRFERGAKIAVQISHPHLLETLEVRRDNGQQPLATEFVTGENLTWLIQKHGSLTEEYALRIGIQIASALQHIHDLNLVHRRVKPGNILIQSNGHAKLTDLAFAKTTVPSEAANEVTRASRPPEAAQYLPPEQVSSAKAVDSRGDLYSLGVTLFVMLTGRFPFKANNTMEMLMDKATNRFPTVRQVNPTVSDATSRLVQWMMQSDPQNRPPSADSFLHAAEECLNRLESRSAESAPKAPKTKPVVIDDGGERDSESTQRQPRPRRRSSLAQRIALGIGVLFIATIAGLLLVKF